MNLPVCVITGVDFYDPVEVRWVRGDLHRVGDCYVVNGNTVAGGNTDWHYGPANTGGMSVAAVQGAYFERRGVIVFDCAVAEFNPRARDYMGNVRGRRL